MINPAVLDGARLLSWARRAAEELHHHREEINKLNVFPVPDSDTGSNMAYTMGAAVRQADELDANAGADAVAEALAVGSIRGARGNSGIVLSQVLRGVAQAAAEGELDAHSVAAALTNAVEFVERAINAPVEGTIITVLREAAHAAEDAVISARGDVALADVTGAALSAAEIALERTPSQLAELREAGVVDAGGTGLVLLLSALHAEVGGATADRQDTAGRHDHEESAAEAGWLEVMFMFEGPVDKLESELSPLGHSLVVARVTDTHGKVHIHTTQAGPVIETAFGLGAVSDLRLEILPDATLLHESRRVGRLIVAVTPPGSVTELYSQAGAVAVAPSPTLIDDVRGEIAASGAHEVIVLPNGQLDDAAQAAVASATDDAAVSVHLLPTVRLVAGIAALAVHDPRQPVEQAAALMLEAASEMDVADIEASESGTGPIRVVGPHGVIAEGESVGEAVDKACRAMLVDGGEMVTILLAPHAAEELDADALEASLGAEVHVYPADGVGTLGQIGVE